MTKKREIKPDEKMEWEQMLQLLTLDGIATKTSFKIDELAFHGGTSLRMSWNSPRFSEDLDFMISEVVLPQLPDKMNKVFDYMKAKLLEVDPKFSFRTKEVVKRDGAMMVYNASLEKEGVIGSARVKMEFWRVKPEYLDGYKPIFKQILPIADLKMRVNDLLPVADLKTAYCDKIVALSTRPFVKWRDLFDIWWLRSQNSLDPINDPDFMDRFKHNLSAYNVGEGKTLKSALSECLSWNTEELLKKSELELKKWLSPSLWEKLYPDTVKEMIRVVQDDVSRVLAKLEEPIPMTNNSKPENKNVI